MTDLRALATHSSASVWRGVGAAAYLAVGLVVATACQSDHRAGITFHARDSVGIRVVENDVPRWPDGRGWRIEAIPAVTLGAGNDAREELFAVRDIVPLASDGFVLVDAATSQLRSYDSTGTPMWTVGRQGQGPGEFRNMWNLLRCGGDTLLVNDGAQVDVIDPQGGFVRRSPVHRAAGAGNVVYGVSEDCTGVLLAAQVPREPPARVFQPMETLYWSALRVQRFDTVATVPGDDLKGIDVLGVRYGLFVPFGSFSVWDTDGRRVYLARSNKAEIQVFDRGGGIVRVIRWPARALPVSAADREAFELRRAELIRRSPNEERFAPPLDRFPEVVTRPLFSRIMVDAAGTLWIREYPVSQGGFPRGYRPPRDRRNESWTIIDSSGAWLGAISLPAGLDIRAIGPRTILGVSTTEEGFARVKVYRIRRP